MKKLVLVPVLMAIFSLSAHANFIRDARINHNKGTIDIDVVYGGGCKEHHFELQIGLCLETFPVSCQAKLVDLTEGDMCEALVPETVSIPLSKYELDTEYYRGGSLTISGPDGSKAKVRLPR